MSDSVDVSDEDFQQLILKLLERYTVATLATEIRVSHPTIERWSRGKNLPHRFVRHSIVQYVSTKL